MAILNTTSTVGEINIYDALQQSVGGNSLNNILDGSQIGSVRTSGSIEEDSSYTIGRFAFAEGNSTTASGAASHAEGLGTTASRDGSHAEGFQTTASGETSHAEGYSTEASGDGSHAEGQGTTARGDYQHVSGKYNIEDSNNTYSVIVGNGTSTSSRSNSYTLDWNGNAWFAGSISVGHDNTKLSPNLRFTTAIPTTGWSSSSPYTITISLSGITSNMVPVIDLVLDSDAGTAISQIEAWSCVSKIETGEGNITVTCYDSIPTVEIPIQMITVFGN